MHTYTSDILILSFSKAHFSYVQSQTILQCYSVQFFDSALHIHGSVKILPQSATDKGNHFS